MKTLLVSIASLLASTLNAQDLQWVGSIGGASLDYGSSIATDASGNVYVAGYFEGTTDLDPGSDVLDATSAGGTDIFVEKLDGSGDLLWARSMGGVSIDQGLSVAVDNTGNVYTTGYFEGTADLDPGSGVFELISSGGADVFVQKLDASGNFLWARSMGGPSDDLGNSVSVDALGNVYSTGYFGGTADFDPGTSVSSLTSAGLTDVFVQKLDASGNLLWARSMGGSSNDIGNSIGVDASGNVYTAGYFEGTTDLDPGTDVFDATSAGLTDLFIQKMDASGNFLWARSIGGAGSENCYSIRVDATGNVYATGHFEGTVDFDPGTVVSNLTSAGDLDVFVQKLDASGDLLWARSMGGTSEDIGSSVALDASGNVYTTGYFRGTADLDPGAGTNNLASAGDRDIFIQKMDGSGNFVWAKAAGGTLFDSGSSIATDASGYVYTTGFYQGTVNFDPGTGTADLTSAGDRDAFVLKMDQNSMGIDDHVNDVKVVTYPNPTIKAVCVSLEQPAHDAELTLTDLSGKVIFQQTYGTLKSTRIELPSPAGMYVLTLKTQEGQSTTRLVKE